MRALLVSRQHDSSHGGIGTYVQRFCRTAREAGWHVELLTQPGTNWPPCARVHEVTTCDQGDDFHARLDDLRRREVVRPYRYALWATAVARKLMHLMEHHADAMRNLDFIEFVDCQAEGFAALTCPMVRDGFGAARMIVHAHTPMWIEETINGCEQSRFGRERYHQWERQAIAAADGVLVTSRVMANAIVEESCAHVIPYPIADHVPSSSETRCERIVLVGSVQPRKGVDVWARSLSEVLRARPRATAMLIGPDTSTAPDGLSMAAHVQRLIDPRVIDRFRWAGSMPHDRVLQAIAQSSLVVVPSRLESFSFVAAEAIMLGTPVIVSDQTGIAEHVPSLMTAPSGDSRAWASAQLSALERTDALSRQAARCREELLERCSPGRVLAERTSWMSTIQRKPCRSHHADGFAQMSAFIEAVNATSEVSSAMS